TVGDPGASGVGADEDVYSVGALPQRTGLDFQQVPRLAEGMEDLLPNEGVQRLAPVALHVGGLRVKLRDRLPPVFSRLGSSVFSGHPRPPCCSQFRSTGDPSNRPGATAGAGPRLGPRTAL